MTERNIKKELKHYLYNDYGEDIEDFDYDCLIELLTELFDRIEKLEDRLEDIAPSEKVLKTVFSQMTDKKTLECEIEEYALGIEQKAKEIGKLKDILDRKEQQLKQMKETDISKLLKEMENHKSPAEEAYKEIYGIYPVYPSDVRFGYFKTGYIASQKDCKVEEPKPKKLYEVLTNLGYYEDNCDEIVDAVEEWLLKEQSAAGSQNAYVESAVEGYNDAINKIRRKLR